MANTWGNPQAEVFNQLLKDRIVVLGSEVEDDIAAGTLVTVLDEHAAPPNGIYAVFPQRRHLPLRVRLWIDFLKRTYGDSRYWTGAT